VEKSGEKWSKKILDMLDKRFRKLGWLMTIQVFLNDPKTTFCIPIPASFPNN
jgi:hypothetical protein